MREHGMDGSPLKVNGGDGMKTNMSFEVPIRIENIWSFRNIFGPGLYNYVRP